MITILVYAACYIIHDVTLLLPHSDVRYNFIHIVIDAVHGKDDTVVSIPHKILIRPRERQISNNHP